MLDCYWNGGSPKAQSRYYDNLVISTQKIGTLAGTALGKNNRNYFSQAGAKPHCSIILANRRIASISAEIVFDIRGQRVQSDQVRPGGIFISVNH